MHIFRTFLLLLFPVVGFAQATTYPTDYFRNPLDIPILLAGNFGECRPGHFHSGLDIKTQGKENLPVYAAADGYVSRIKTDKGGFGHAIYITHPNGYTTLYAHLNDYAPFLQQHLREQQYRNKRWNLDLTFTPDQFPVNKGQQIAWSGNTGSSTAPHLHFEVRDTKTEHPLNPQLFGFSVKDDLSPVLKEMYFYYGNVYDGKHTAVPVSLKGKTYKPTKMPPNSDTLLLPQGLTGIGFVADDYMNGSDNSITFYTAQFWVNNVLQTTVTLNDIGYDVSRYIHAYTDYTTKHKQKKWVQCMFRIPGNKLKSLYTSLNENDGKILIDADTTQLLRLLLTDNNGNTSVAEFYVKGTTNDMQPTITTNCTPFIASKSNEYQTPNIDFVLDENQLYDDICFHTSATPSAATLTDKYQLHYPFIPLHHYFELRMKPNKTIPLHMRSKVVLLYSDGKDINGMAATPTDKGWYKANVRNLGTYWLHTDTTPPVINSLQKNGANLSKAKQITFNAKDATTSIRMYSGLLDGKWICFEQHGNSFFYVFDDHCSPGKHQLIFTAEDENDNEATFKLDFVR